MSEESKPVRKTVRKQTIDKDRIEGDEETVTLSSIKRLIIELQTEFFYLKDIVNSKLDSQTKSISKMEKTLSKKLNDDLKSLRAYFEGELRVISDRVMEVEKRMDDFEEKEKEKAMFDIDSTVVITNLKTDNDENIMKKCDDLIKDGLGLHDIHVINAKRLPSRTNKPGLVKMQVESLEQKKRVLREKQKLKDINGYDKVFLRSSKTHQERAMEANFKQMLQAVPSLKQFRLTGNGKLVLKDAAEGEAPARDNPRNPRPFSPRRRGSSHLMSRSLNLSPPPGRRLRFDDY